MQSLSEIFRRNRTVIVLFTVLVIMPSVVLGYLGFRAIRSDNVEQQFEQRNRQRQIALLLNDEVKSWLFSQQPDGAASHALFRFTINGEGIVFPDFRLSFPAGTQKNPAPVDSTNGGPRGDARASGPDVVPNAREIEEVYYPRIQFFLRDFKRGQNPGAQYFRRLNAMIVQVPGTPNGYILKSSQLIEFSKRKLDALTEPATFHGILQID